jgi:hypothetical protein
MSGIIAKNASRSSGIIGPVAGSGGGTTNNSVDTMTGDGSDTTLALSVSPGSENNVQITFDGVTQHHSTFSLSGSTITFSTAPAVGVLVEAVSGTASTTGTPDDDTVNLAQLASGTDGELFTWDTSGDPAKVAVGTANHVLTSNGAGAAPTFQAGGAATGFIGGLICSNDTDTDHDILISVGSARDYGDAVTMTLGTAITKRIDATWAVGDDAGGLDSTDTVGGDTGYGVYLIRRSDTGVVDVMFSSDMTSAGSALTLPTNYDQKRLIGWVLTDASANIITFTQSGDYFRLTGDIIQLLNDSTITSNTYETLTVTAPPLCIAHIYGNMSNASSTGLSLTLSIRTKDAAEAAGDQKEAWIHDEQPNAPDKVTGIGMVLMDAASAVEYTCTESDGTANVSINIIGITMLTRSNP